MSQSGITFIELILVVAIIALLGATSTPFLSRFIIQTQFNASVDKVEGSIRKAQQYAMAEKNGSTWGVCLTGTLVRLFSGSCASPTISEDFDIPTTVSISGLSTTTFTKRGEPSGALTITIVTSQNTKTVQLNTAGGLNIN